MPKSCIVGSGALAALLDPRDQHHAWARATLLRQSPPWLTCEAAVSEALFLLSETHTRALDKLLREGYVRLAFDLAENLEAVLDLRAKYTDVPMSLADACLVRMTEMLPDPIVVTADSDFAVYRRHSRQTIPCLRPR